jgi:hypothetical protein
MPSVRKLVAVGLILAGIGLVAIALTSSETDQDAVARQLHRLADAVSVQEGEALLVRRARLNGVFADVLTEDVRVDAPELGSVEPGRGHVALVATRAANLYQAGRVELANLEIRVSDAGKSAEVQAQARLVASARGDELRREERHVVFELEKQHGDWRVRSVEVARAAGADQ